MGLGSPIFDDDTRASNDFADRDTMSTRDVSVGRTGSTWLRPTTAGLLGGLVGVAAAYVLVGWADASIDSGPTAAAVEKGYAELLGGSIGVFLAGAIGAAITSRSDSRVLAGSVSGGVAYGFLGILFVVTTPSGASASEAVSFAFLLMLPAAVVLGVGIAVGSVLGKALSDGQ